MTSPMRVYKEKRHCRPQKEWEVTMEKIRIYISDKLKKEMDRYPEINWNAVALAGIQKELKKLQEREKTKKSGV
jgi:hypothetical protein